MSKLLLPTLTDRKRPVESLDCYIYIFEDTMQSAFTHSWLHILEANEDISCSFSDDPSIQYPDSFQFIFGVFGAIQKEIVGLYIFENKDDNRKTSTSNLL